MIINPGAGFAVDSQYFEYDPDLHKTQGWDRSRNLQSARPGFEHGTGFGARSSGGSPSRGLRYSQIVSAFPPP